MIENLTKDNGRVTIRDTIRMGCKSVEAYCASCNKKVYAWILDGKGICPTCQGHVTLNAAAQQKPAVLPFFYIPKEYRSILGDSPSTLSVIPAYQTLEQIIPHGFARFCKGVKLPICVGDGKQATLRENGMKKNVPCTSECRYRKQGYCKITGRFYFYLPEIDMMSAFQMKTSQISTTNIITTLKRMVGDNGNILRQICTLRLSKGVNSVGQPFTYAELLPPAIPLSKLQAMGLINPVGGVVHCLP